MAALELIEAERDHWERRCQRLALLEEEGRREGREESDYADGVRYGLDLARLIVCAQLRQAEVD